jgi:hypothetical protein
MPFYYYSAVLDNAVLPAAQTAKFAKSLSEAVDKEGKIRIYIQQARRLLRENDGDSYSSHIEQFTLLENLLIHLKSADPGGVYYMKTQPLQYKVAGASRQAYEFKEVVIIPCGFAFLW